jgi:hypothetical protein
MHGAVLLLALAQVQGSGRVVDQARNVPEFSGIHVSAGIQAKISIGNRSVVIRGDDNIVPLVRTEVHGGRLDIGWEPNTSHTTHSSLQVIISAPRLDDLEASGGAGIEGGVGSGDALQIDASGGSHIHVSAERKQIDAHGSGGAVLALEGKAEAARLHASGGTVVKAARLSVGNVEVEGSGGADLSVDANGTVRGSLSGGSTARVGPRAKVEVHTSGGSEVLR